MKINLIVFCLILLISGCHRISDLTKTKPVEIDGLGSLQANSQKQFDEAELTKIVETVIEQKRVNGEDARAMLDIYKREIEYFIKASAFDERSENHFEKHDVEGWLGLILQHENLREEARQFTEQRIIDALAGWIRFNESDKTGMAGAAAALSAAYHNAYNQAIAKDNQELRSENYGRTHRANNVAVVTAFERTAHEIIGNERAFSKEQNENARQFIQALQIYDDSLPAGENILDQNARLVNSQSASERQGVRIADIFSRTTSGDEQNATTLDKAVNFLNDRMSPTYRELREATNNQMRPK